MAPNYTRLDSIQSRAVNVAKRTTFGIRRNALRSIERNDSFAIGNQISTIQETTNNSIVRAYIAGFETTVPERGIPTVQRRYRIDPENILRNFGTNEPTRYLYSTLSNIETKIIELQYSSRTKTYIRQEITKEISGISTRLETIINTATAAAFNAGRMAGFSLPRNDERIWGYRYQTQKDDKVRDNHAAMQGFTREKNDPVWTVYMPPNGFNCRCWLEPLTRPANESIQLPELPDPNFRGPLNAS